MLEKAGFTTTRKQRLEKHFMLIMRKIVKLPVTFYQICISPLIGGRCRFHPTCSHYAAEAIDTHGAIKGLFLSLRRFGSCHPWHCGGYHDPVPKTFTWSSKIGYNRDHKLKNTNKIIKKQVEH